VCDTSRRTCVECNTPSDCGAGNDCDDNHECVPVAPPPPTNPPPSDVVVTKCNPPGSGTCPGDLICLPGGYCGKPCFSGSTCDSGWVCVGSIQCYLRCDSSNRCPLETGLICKQVDDPLLTGQSYDLCVMPGTLAGKNPDEP
jgi:hypothetical protein